MNAKGTKCEDIGWNFYGTPLYAKYHKFIEETSGKPHERCSKEELKELRARKFRDLGKFCHSRGALRQGAPIHIPPPSCEFTDAEEYREDTLQSNKEVFERERAERETLRRQADSVLEMLETNPGALRANVKWMEDSSDDEIREMADRLKRLADSPHPVEGLWDSHGRIIDKK
jgi:hypothetical protein